MIPIAVAAALVAAAVFIFSKPIRFVLRVLMNVALGFAALAIVNFIGAEYGINLDINWLNAIVTGVLGIPGVAILIVLTYFGIL